MTTPAPVASLPMYDWPEVEWAHDSLWSALSRRLAAHGVAAPKTLDRMRAFDELWHDPGLVLSQTCGWPYATRLHGVVRLVATPVYAAKGCEGPYYSSMIVVRKDEPAARLSDLRNRRLAFNTRDSLSGFVAAHVAVRDEGMEEAAFSWIPTGSHRASVRAVARGSADVGFIDAVCWALAADFEPEAAAELRVLATTPLRPALPLITAVGRSDEEVAAIRAALSEALASGETAEARTALKLGGAVALDEADYLSLPGLLR